MALGMGHFLCLFVVDGIYSLTNVAPRGRNYKSSLRKVSPILLFSAQFYG
jgi:hypothetical protein